MKTYEVYIDRTETVLVQAMDSHDAKAHALGEEPDAPGCVIESFGTETNDVRAVQTHDHPVRASGLPTYAEIDFRADQIAGYRAALESIAEGPQYTNVARDIARRALGMVPL